jgi:hypothetical protein
MDRLQAPRRGGRLALLHRRQHGLPDERGRPLRAAHALRGPPRRPGRPRSLLRRRLGQAGFRDDARGRARPLGRASWVRHRRRRLRPADGRWLVVSVSRDYFAPTATVTCRQPGKEKLEPASERATRAANASEGGGGSPGPRSTTARSPRSCTPRPSASATRAAPTSTAAATAAALSTLASGQGLDCSSSSVARAQARRNVRRRRRHRLRRVRALLGAAGRGSALHRLGQRRARLDAVPRPRQRVALRHLPYGSGGRGPRLRFTTARPRDSRRATGRAADGDA